MELKAMVPELSTEPARKFLRRRTRYAVGLDLGQAGDPTAVAVLEHTTGVWDEGSDWERHTGLSSHLQTPCEFLDVRHLERLSLGMPYPAQVEHVMQVMSRAPLCGVGDRKPAKLIMDETGVGRAVGDIFSDAGLSPIRLTITAGAEERGVSRDRFHVAKANLISRLDAMLHIGALRFAADLPDASALKDELRDFRRKLSDAGRATYSARSGAHDDLVLAVAIAVWWLVRPPPPSPIFGRY